MLEQAEQASTFIGKLFETLVLSRLKGSDHQIALFTYQENGNLPFYENVSRLILTCKNEIKKLCLNADKIQETIARKIINTLMFLTKDVQFLLDEGILNLYIDLIELKEKISQLQNHPQEKKFVENCIIFIEPLLHQFFVLREYKRIEKIEAPKSKNESLIRKFSGQSTQDQQANSRPASNKILNLNQQEVASIREQILTKKINELLDEFLNEYQMELNELQEVCKICSKHIKLNHLEEHVEYCQKKYILKQNLKSLQKKILSYANQLILIRKNIPDEGSCQIGSGSLTEIEDLDSLEDQTYGQLLFEVVNVHKIGSVKNNTTSKKIQSQAKIKESTDKYEELIEKLQNYLENKSEQSSFYEEINTFLTMEKKILQISLQLRTVEIEYENLRQIVSSSTIRAPSRASTARISEKKSRFACVRNIEKSSQRSKSSQIDSRSSKIPSKNSQSGADLKNQSRDDQCNFGEEQFVRFQNFQSQNEFEEQNLVTLGLKTKQSLGNNKNVHFNEDAFEEEYIKLPEKQKCRKSKIRRVKSMVMFDNSDSEDENEDNKNSDSTSRPGQNVGIKDFEILKFLGKGAFGKVYAVRKRNTEDLYALKMIDIDEKWGPQEFQQISNQHQIFKKVAGEHLVQAPFCFSQGGVHVFMMEFMPGGDLSKVLEEEVYLQEQRAKHVIAEIVLAIEHLHRADIIHRDLKPENLVIDERGHLKLTDFGLSEIKIQNKLQKVMNIKKDAEDANKQRRRNRRTGIVAVKQNAKIIGTPDYIAPEIINGISINNRSIDWWSLGVIAYEILIGVRPFCGNSVQEVLDNILKFRIEWPEIGQEEGMISERSYDLIQKLLDRDFVNRLGANGIQQIKDHPFFSGVDWQNLKHQPAYIMPNYPKIRELLEMKENQELRKDIEQKAGKPLPNVRMPELDNFIRFDILGEKTVKSANKVKSKKTGTLKRLQSIKEFIADKENEPTRQWLNPFQIEDNKKFKSFVEFDSKDKLEVNFDDQIV